MTDGVRYAVRELRGGDLSALVRFGALCVGLALAGLGYAVGTVEWTIGQRRRLGPGRT